MLQQRRKNKSLRLPQQKKKHRTLVKLKEAWGLLLAPSKLYQPLKSKADSPELNTSVLKIPTARFHNKKLNLLLTLWFVYYQYIQMSKRGMSYKDNNLLKQHEHETWSSNRKHRVVKKILWGKPFSVNLPIWLEWQDSYLSIVEDDRTDKSPSTASHLTTVDQILQFTDLHCTLKAEQKWRKRRK